MRSGIEHCEPDQREFSGRTQCSALCEDQFLPARRQKPNSGKAPKGRFAGSCASGHHRDGNEFFLAPPGSWSDATLKQKKNVLVVWRIKREKNFEYRRPCRVLIALLRCCGHWLCASCLARMLADFFSRIHFSRNLQTFDGEHPVRLSPQGQAESPAEKNRGENKSRCQNERPKPDLIYQTASLLTFVPAEADDACDRAASAR